MKTYTYHINLDERGEFFADVRDQDDNTVYEIHLPDSDGGSGIIGDGFMKHERDVAGLERYLKQIGIMQNHDTLEPDQDNNDNNYMENGGNVEETPYYMEVANVIAQQLGGTRRMALLTGAHNFVAGKDEGTGNPYLSFKIKNNPGKPNYVKISLNSLDYYELEFGVVSGANYTVTSEIGAPGVDAEDLLRFVEDGTGMYFSLFEDGGEIVSPAAWIRALNLEAMTPEAAQYMRDEVLTDPGLDQLGADDQFFQKFVAYIQKNAPQAIGKPGQGGGDKAPAKKILEARLKLIEKMIAANPGNVVLKTRKKLVMKMISGTAMAKGGEVEPGHGRTYIVYEHNEPIFSGPEPDFIDFVSALYGYEAMDNDQSTTDMMLEDAVSAIVGTDAAQGLDLVITSASNPAVYDYCGQKMTADQIENIRPAVNKHSLSQLQNVGDSIDLVDSPGMIIRRIPSQVEESVSEPFKRGGRIKSALMRDRAYKSNQPHELRYKRVRSPKNPRYKMADGGEVADLERELHRLQRELNSSRLNKYIEGDESDEEKLRLAEREKKLARFNEVLTRLRTISPSFSGGGRLKSALMRDRAYKSDEPHELRYNRVRSPKNPRYNR
mgnify:CR=1 FL=1